MKLDTRTQAGLEAASRRLFAAHRNDPNFTGCGIGYRRRGGERTGELAVIAMVGKKLSAGLISRHRLLPETVEDWGVDVVEVGRPSRHAGTRSTQTSTSLTDVWRPVVQGVSVGNHFDIDMVGTVGCLVYDKSDDTLCLLSSNHAIGGSGSGSEGETITQPAPLDIDFATYRVGTLKRFVPISTSPNATTNRVDAAIAQLDDQTLYSDGVALNLMRPISSDHPAVGMVVAGDPGTNCFLARMDSTLTALGVQLVPEKSGSSCTVEPEIDMIIEKVGRTSGYTSSTVDAIAAQVKIDFSPSGNGTDIRVMSDMIWTQAFSLAGDSGVVACMGGDGQHFAIIRIGCVVLGVVGDYYHLPLTDDNTLTSQARDQFLSQSLVGNLCIGLIYQNSQTLIDRYKSMTASGPEIGYASQYYQKYHDFLAGLLANPGSGTTVTEENLGDIEFIIAGLGGAFGVQPVLTEAEGQAAAALCTDVIANTEGMDYYQVLAYMNETSVYHTVVNQLATVPTLLLTGPIVAG